MPFRDGTVVTDDFAVDDLAANYAAVAGHGVVADWTVSGGQLHAAATDKAIYRTDVTSGLVKSRVVLAAGQETDPVEAILAFDNGWMVTCDNPRLSGQFYIVLWHAGSDWWNTFALTAGTQTQIVAFEIEKSNNSITVRSFNAAGVVLDEFSYGMGSWISTVGDAVAAHPGLRTYGANVDVEALRGATVVPITTARSRRRGTRGKVSRRTIPKSTRINVARRFKVGQVWPRGSRGR